MYLLSCSNTTLTIHLFPVGHLSPPASSGVGPHSPHHTSVSLSTAHHPTTQSTGHTTNTYRVPRTVPEPSVKPTTAEQGHFDRYVCHVHTYTHVHMYVISQQVIVLDEAKRAITHCPKSDSPCSMLLINIDNIYFVCDAASSLFQSLSLWLLF